VNACSRACSFFDLLCLYKFFRYFFRQLQNFVHHLIRNVAMSASESPMIAYSPGGSGWSGRSCM